MSKGAVMFSLDEQHLVLSVLSVGSVNYQTDPLKVIYFYSIIKFYLKHYNIIY